MTIAFYDAARVEELLDYPGCIDVMRQAMIALSSGERPQPLRQIFAVGSDGMFGTMPGELAALSTFGAKLVSVFGDPHRPGRSRHQGVVVAYDGVTGAVSCIADAEPVTQIRTACATAAATDALARADAGVLAIFGTGIQAESHLRAVPLVRQFRQILLWGRSPEGARLFAEQMSRQLDLPIVAVSDAREAAAAADVICTVTSSAEPVLLGDWVKPGTHVNLAGSSYLGPVEVDTALVAKDRYVADYRPVAPSSRLQLLDQSLADAGDVILIIIVRVVVVERPGRRLFHAAVELRDLDRLGDGDLGQRVRFAIGDCVGIEGRGRRPGEEFGDPRAACLDRRLAR